MYRTRLRLCATRDGTRVVPADHPEAFTLFAPEGKLIPDEDAKRYDLRAVEEQELAARETRPAPKAPKPPKVAPPQSLGAVVRKAQGLR